VNNLIKVVKVQEQI